MHYFAYGSNMHVADMAARCPGARAISTALMRDYAIGVTRDGYVGIAPRRGRRVHGVVWQVTPRDLVALDRYERAGTRSYRPRTVPLIVAGRIVRALVYCAAVPMDRSRPRRDYLGRTVLGAALSWGLSDRYVAELARLARVGFRA